MRATSPEARCGWLRREGWPALLLGTAAECYLVFALAMTAIAVLPLALGWHGSVVQTGSMQPHVRPGDVVLSTELSDDSPVPLGGVVEFRTAAPGGGERTVLHRVVAPAEEHGQWVTAGDANADVDSTPLTRDAITGQARVLVRWVGLPSIWVRDGRTAHLVAWGSATVAAVVLVAATWPSRGGGRPGAPARTAGGTAAPALTRRTFLAAAVAVTAGGTALVGHDPAWARFSARTATTGNTFRVGQWSAPSVGRLASFAILGATYVANEGSVGNASAVNGSVGVSPGTTVVGFRQRDITGSVDLDTPAARNARTDALALYDAARTRVATRAAVATLTGTVGAGTTHRAGPVQVTGTLTLDARGDASALFVVTATSLTFAPGSAVVLANGAAADRVVFLSTSTANVGDGAHVRGVLLANGDLTAARASVTGRLVSLRGGVHLTRTMVTAP